MLVKVPYNLRVDDEVRIYEKLLGDSGLKGVHTAPHTLKVASMFAILTRLEPSKKAGLGLMKKLKLYNDENVEGFTSKDVKELQEEAQREGMIGISPVYIPDLHRARSLTAPAGRGPITIKGAMVKPWRPCAPHLLCYRFTPRMAASG